MPDDLTPPPRGARQIKHSFLAALANEARTTRRGRARVGADNSAGAPANVIRIRNDSGADVAAGGVLGISDFLITPTENLDEFLREPMLVGVTPDEDDHFAKFVILRDPISNGEIGAAFAYGTAPAQINMTDATHKFADVTDASTASLTSTIEGSARILCVQSGTGLKWGLVLLTGVDAGICVTSG
jgi:hypothetical protein